MKEYYTQLIQDTDRILERMKEPLPVTFRLANTQWKGILQALLGAFRILQSTGDVYTVGVSKKEIKAKKAAQRRDQDTTKNGQDRDSEEVAKLHELLKVLTRTPSVTRQEVVSMLPVQALDVQKTSKVLDMCASPGSKSSQILERLGTHGLLVCNDVSSRRVDQLVSQTKRYGHPGLIVTCNDATSLPGLSFQPDRVLCDVPCSGDGTIRKNRHILEKWSVAEGRNLFSVQRKILKRGLDMLAPGGILVYSTCSMNPVENELVVACALQDVPGSELVPFEIAEPDGIKMHPGLEFEQVARALHLTDLAGVLKNVPSDPAFFHGLKNTRRVYPHDQNTGAFYIAKILKRRRTGKEDPAHAFTRSGHEESAKKTNSSPEEPESIPRHIRGEKNVEESHFYEVADKTCRELEQEWGPCSLHLVAKTQACNNVYGVSEPALKILEDAPNALRIVLAGTRVYAKYGSKRVSAETQRERRRPTPKGAEVCVLPPEKIVGVDRRQLLRILKQKEKKETDCENRKGMLVLQLAGTPEHPEISLPVMLTQTEAEVLLAKDQKQALVILLEALEAGPEPQRE